MLLRPVCSRFAALVVCVVVGMLGVSCSDDDGARATTEGDARAEGSTSSVPTITSPTGPYGVPDLVASSLGGDEGQWTGMKASEDRLYAQQPLEGERVELVRLDPTSGEVLSRAELNNIEGWTVAPAAVFVLAKDRRFVTLRDPITLEVAHEVDLGENARTGMSGDTPRTDDFWLGLRRLDVDQLQGIYTDMAAIRLDLETGEVVERVDAPPCGASVVAEFGDELVMGVVCAEQVATVNRVTGEARSYEAFPSGLTVLAIGDSAFIRWFDFGYLGRLQLGDDAIETLDLNADGPVLSRISPQMAGPRGIWVAGTPVEEELELLLNVIDTESFTVVARAWSPSTVAFIGDVGYVIVDGRLATFDPATVTGGVPDEVVRPDTGPPAAIEPTSDEERAVVEAFTTVFDPQVPDEVAAAYLVEDPATLDLRGRLFDLAEQLYPGVRARVTALAVGEGTASLAYVFLLDEQVAFVPLSGSLEFDGTNWRVTRDTVCRLAAQAAISEC